MKLSESQIRDYRENGYLVLGALLNEAAADRMAQVYMDCVTGHHAGHDSQGVRHIRHHDAGEDNPAGFIQLRCAHLMHPDFDAVMRDDGLLDAVECLIGPDIRVVICQGLYKPPHTGEEIRWHQDDYYFQVDKPDSVVSCWLTFDDATVDNGCMWVIPGGHRRMLDHDRVPSGSGYHVPDIDETNAVPVELKRGQCMLHHGLMPHRTLNNTTSTHRRALAIHYMDATAKPTESRQQEPPENTPVVRGRAG